MMHLVAGGAGFIGSHLTNALVERGDHVVVIDDLSGGYLRNLDRALSTGRTTLVYADIAEPHAIVGKLVAAATHRRIDRIYHVASTPPCRAVPHADRDPLCADTVGTITLVELALEHGARLFYGSGSDGADGDAGAVAHAAAKRVAESAIADAIRLRGLHARVGRFAGCYGPAMSERGGGLIADLFDAVERRLPLDAYVGRLLRPIYVADAVAQVLAALEEGPSSAIPFAIEGPAEHTAYEIAHAIVDVVEYEVTQPKRRMPVIPFRFAATGRRESDVRFPPVDLETGLRATHRWLRDERVAYA